MSWYITALEFENYRSFQRREYLSLRPLTVLIGRNSSGKSAVARLPLLLRRALQPGARAPLELDFDDHDFGASFVDLVSNRVPTRGLTLGLTASDGHTEVALTVTVGYWSEFNLQGIRAFCLQAGGRKLVDLRWDNEGDPVGDGLDYWDQLAPKPPDGQLTDLASVQFDGIVPFNAPEREPGGAAQVTAAIAQLREAVSNIIYLGPFRDTPARDMRLPESAVRDVGLRGGNAARALANDMLRHGSSVLRRVGDWYREHLGGWTLDLVREGQSFSVVLHPPYDPTVAVNLRDAGVGLNQVLPVIVQHELDRASGRTGGLDIIEQPELHLHPGAHGDLADLYVEATARGTGRFIIETHSENFVLRIRRRLAEGRLRPEQVAVYWIDDDAAARPRVRSIGINGKGEVDFWPEGVFAEDYEEAKAIRLAQRDRKQ